MGAINLTEQSQTDDDFPALHDIYPGVVDGSRTDIALQRSCSLMPANVGHSVRLVVAAHGHVSASIPDWRALHSATCARLRELHLLRDAMSMQVDGVGGGGKRRHDYS